MELDDIKINTESDNDFSIIQYNYLNHEILDPVFINSIISDNQKLSEKCICNIVDSLDEDDEPIFYVFNTKREKQKHFVNEDPEKRNHTFKSIDNMIKTLKIKFFKFLFNLCNDYIYYKTKDPNKKILNILHAVKTDITIKVNLIIKDFTLKEIYSLPIGSKYQKYKKDHNHKLIKELSENQLEFKNFFNTKLSEMFPYFVDIKKKDELYKKYKIKKAIPLYELVKTNKQFKKRKPEYIEQLFNLGYNFFDYFNKRNERISQIPKILLVHLKKIIKERGSW
jgi:hypothetical protein